VSAILTSLGRLARGNPMIDKELRGRMRSGRSMLIFTIYLGLIALFSCLFYWIVSAGSAANVSYDQHVGRDLLNGIVAFVTLLVLFLAPAFTAGTISGERERQTFDLLMTTLLKPRSIVLGKMGAALAYLVLLILAVVPLESLAFMIGGVAPEEIAVSLVVLLFTALLYGSIGIFWSSIMRSTIAATVLAYASVLFLLMGLPFLWFVGTTMMATTAGPTGPGFTSSVAYVYFTGIIVSTNPVLAMGFSEAFFRAGKPLFAYVDSGLINGKSILIIQPWLVFCLIALAGSAGLLAFSVRRLPPVRARRAATAAGRPPVAPAAAPDLPEVARVSGAAPEQSDAET
jgi:ABC-2 type transport system permease protein